nr:hypothetical protein [Tanacetum cinerariifolium]
HQNTQQYGAILPIELMNEDIRNTKAYKEYYTYATGEAAPKPKASARRKRSSFDSSTTPPTAVASPKLTIAATSKLTTAAKGKQPAKATKAKSLSAFSDVAMTEAEQLKLVLKRSSNRHIFPSLVVQVQMKEPVQNQGFRIEDDGTDEEDQGFKDGEDEWLNEEEEADELYRDVNINQGRGPQLSQDIIDSQVTLTPVKPDGQQESSSVSSQFVTSMLNLISDVGVESVF